MFYVTDLMGAQITSPTRQAAIKRALIGLFAAERKARPTRPPAKAMTASPVAIIGLGLMGEVYAKRLIDAGIPVSGFDIDPARRAHLKDIGGMPASSIAALAKPARCIIIAVFDTGQVEDVIENHLLPALGPGSGKIVLCMSTCDPDQVAALATRITPRGIRYLDVPVSGTSDQAAIADDASCTCSQTQSTAKWRRTRAPAAEQQIEACSKRMPTGGLRARPGGIADLDNSVIMFATTCRNPSRARNSRISRANARLTTP